MNKQDRNNLGKRQDEINALIEQLNDVEPPFGTMEELSEQLKSLSGKIDDVRSEVESAKDTEQEKYDNMPEGLQNADAGERMQEGIDALEEAQSELETANNNLDDLAKDVATYEDHADIVAAIAAVIGDLEDAASKIDDACSA